WLSLVLERQPTPAWVVDPTTGEVLVRNAAARAVFPEPVGSGRRPEAYFVTDSGECIDPAALVSHLATDARGRRHRSLLARLGSGSLLPNLLARPAASGRTNAPRTHHLPRRDRAEVGRAGTAAGHRDAGRVLLRRHPRAEGPLFAIQHAAKQGDVPGF